MPDSLVVGGQLGNYLIESVIGRGGMSIVFRAQHLRLGTPVALKVLAPELSSDDKFRERFLREAKMAAGIDHPNVIPIYDTGLQDESLYIVMRNVAGGDLKALLREEGPMDPARAVAILTPVARALDAAHAHGLVHRDVKPANILLQRSAAGEIEHVYLTDFGVTKHATSVSGLTGTGAVIGTADYMAPEQIESLPVSSQTDTYALGCVLYQCLTGSVPFARDSDVAVLWAHVRDPVDPPSGQRPGLTTALDAPIAKALAKAPEDRYATCQEFMNACHTALTSERPATGSFAGPPSYQATLTSVDAPSPSSAPPAGVKSEPAGTGAAVAPPPAPSDGQPRTAAERPPGGRGWLAEHWSQVALLVVLVVGGIVAAVALISGSSSPSPSSPASQEPGGGGIPANLKPVPTNRVNGRGRARVRLRGDVATVTLNAAGLLNGAPHAMHFHAGGKGTCPPASAAHLHHGNLSISTSNGGAYYGGAVTALTTRGDTSVGSILAFTRFPVTGTIAYSRTIRLASGVAGLIRKGNAVLVIHGIDYNDNGIYDGVLDRSELDRKYFGESTAPGLCGPLVPGAGGGRASLPTRGSHVYTASLAVEADQSSVWACQLAGASDDTLGTREKPVVIA